MPKTMRLVSASSVLFCILFSLDFVKENGKPHLQCAPRFCRLFVFFVICRHAFYALTLGMGLLLFLILGAFGSAVFYKTLCLIEDNTYIARLTGVSYMLGILLQIANNNLVHIDYIEAGILSAFILLLAFMLIKAEKTALSLPSPKAKPKGKTTKAERIA